MPDRDPRSAIAAILDALQPSTLLLVGNALDPWQAWCASHCDAAITCAEPDETTLEPLGHFDCALVIGATDQLEKRTAEELLGRLRNVHTAHLYVLATDDPRWPLTSWLALALQRLDRFDDAEPPVTLYAYDLSSYNRTRSWNNPRYWANPENWNRYRW